MRTKNNKQKDGIKGKAEGKETVRYTKTHNKIAIICTSLLVVTLNGSEFNFPNDTDW